MSERDYSYTDYSYTVDFSNTTIDTLDRAREFFQAMGCSSFHMTREYPERLEEYRKLGISEETEREWTLDNIARGVARLGDRKATKPSQLWQVHSRMEDLVQLLKTSEALRLIYEATEEIAPRVAKRSKILLAETIIGRSALTYRSGLVFLAHDLGEEAIAQRLAEIAVELATSSRDAGSEPERSQDALDKCGEIRTVLGLT